MQHSGAHSKTKRPLIHLLVLGVLAMGAFAPLASAQSTPCTNGSLDPQGICVPDNAAPTTPAPDNGTANKISTSLQWATVTGGQGIASVMNVIMQLFAWMLGVAAITLDNAVYYTVVTMGGVVNQLSAIGVSWRILRDIGNIALIFGFLVIGISIILDTERLGYGKKMLPTLLFVAVTLNFSLFVAEGVIDVSNLFATQFYTQINGGQLAGTKEYSDIASGGISNKVMAQLGFANIYNAGNVNPNVFKDNNNILIDFMGIILFVVTSFVFFSLAFILIFRFVALVLLIVSSPVGFAGLAVPKLENVAHKWWSELVDQAITAPVLLLLLYVALAVITDVNFLSGFGTSSSGWYDFFNPSQQNLSSFAGTILSFVVAMGLLLSVTVVAKRIGAAGADRAMKWAGKASFGVAAIGARTAIGWPSNYLARKVRTTALGRTATGRLLASGFDRGAKATFDVRSTSLLKDLPIGGINAGEAAKDGYRGILERATKTHEEYGKSLRAAHTEAGHEAAVGVAAQERYGTNLQRDALRNWILFGPGGTTAGRKIAKAAQKSTTPEGQFEEAAKEYLAHQTAKIKAEATSAARATTPPPAAAPAPVAAAPAPAAAAPAGGTGHTP